MKKLLFFFAVSIAAITAVAQQTTKEYTTQKGYKGSVEVGFAAGSGDYAHNRGEFLIINGYQFNPYLSVGIGTGIQVFEVSKDVTMPLFADIEATFLQKTISPFVDIKVGYCWALSKDIFLPKEGVYFSPTIGFRWGMNQCTVLMLGVGYLVQGSKVKENYLTPNALSDQIYFQSLVSRVAFDF